MNCQRLIGLEVLQGGGSRTEAGAPPCFTETTQIALDTLDWKILLNALSHELGIEKESPDFIGVELTM